MTPPKISDALIILPGRYRTLWEIPVVMLILTLIAAFTANAYWISTLTSALAIALAARGIGVLYGLLGLVSLCQFALIGVGGWTMLRLGHGTGLPFELNVLLAGVVAAAVGVVWGAPALKLKGLYLALVTLMLAGAYQVVISATGFPDGGQGWLGRADAIQRLMLERPVVAQNSTRYLIYCAAWATLGFMAAEWLRLAKPGRAWAMIRKDDRAAMSAGVNLLVYKIIAFAFAGFLAGVGGALLAGSVGQLDGRAFAASESLSLFALSVVAGVYNWYGALIAGLLLRAVPSLLTDFEINGYAAIVFYGTALLHAIITAPRGIAGQISGLITRIKALLGRKTPPRQATRQEDS
ncbi:branched-chain amino acid ABC transporter permease [Cognatishimia sp. SS12]|uniref:branched-chain amino acid ABC transporter permease n=1 Tax=Cognatishimia sp. SS12 TaxID=2979465 RepID=UPI00232C1D3D|nr:branched-chain amino acid ABC transporter permease [Cognatishimia sp. SS12]MDC0739335.1 branched-chain amino acid ABC transporter permease [Cognatishimia sp. SS12]